MLNAATAPSPSPLPPLQAANFLNLLIIDDDLVIRDAAQEVGHSLGFSTHIADSPGHVFRLIDSAHIDAVLLDLRFAGGNGLETLENIKRHRNDAVVIVVTGFASV